MDELERRIIVLEERLQHQAWRLDRLESGRGDHLLLPESTFGAIPKLLLAVGLTLLAFLVTGDPKAALNAARLGLGGP